MNSSSKRSGSLRYIWLSTYELLGSMRFAVSLLTLVCIVTIIGTVLQQHKPEVEYLDQFGTFWYTVFRTFGVNSIYNAWWFLVLMGFLVVSTTICLIRNVPKMVRDMFNYREYIREKSLKAFPHRFEKQTTMPIDQVGDLAVSWLKKEGYWFKIKESEQGVLYAAKKGSANRIGYICAHVAIVVICLGGLLDSELPLQTQVWLYNKQPIPETARYVSDVKPASIFGPGNISFRGNISISEGGDAGYALLDAKGKQYLQDLPFDVHLNKFIIEYYKLNGMPKRFASDVVVTDKKTGKKYPTVIEVNHPFSLHGITLYQNSFHDGGSKLSLEGYNVVGSQDNVFHFDGVVGQSQEIKLTINGKPEVYRIQFDDFRPINVEDMARGNRTQKKHSFEQDILSVTGSAAPTPNKNVHNVGPSFTYTLTDKNNQSLQFQNYMLPISNLEKIPVYLIGVRLPQNGFFSYLRIPVDELGGMKNFLALRAAFDNPVMRAEAAKAFAEKNKSDKIPQATFQKLAEQALEIFASDGFDGIDRYVDGVGVPESQRVPENLREPMRTALHEYLLFSAIELNNMVREKLGLPALNLSDPKVAEKQATWFDLALRAISNLSHYPSPVIIQLKSFKHIQGSVLQATRSPGKDWVYLGCLLLVIGVFSMFYIRDRRIWIWLKDSSNGSTMTAAMTSQKRNMDFEREFMQFKSDFESLS